MKATLKSGKVIGGKLAEIFVRKGIAKPIEEVEEQEVEKVEEVKPPETEPSKAPAVKSSDEPVKQAAEKDKLDLIKAGQKKKPDPKRSVKKVNTPKKVAVKRTKK